MNICDKFFGFPNYIENNICNYYILSSISNTKRCFNVTYSLVINLYPVFLIVFHAAMNYDSLYLTLKYADVQYMHDITLLLLYTH